MFQRKLFRRGDAGLTLIEVIVSSAVLAIALVGLISGLLSSMRLRELNNEKALARNAAEQTLSAIRGMPSIVDAYARFGGGGPEETFDVYGLAEPAAGTPVGRVFIWRSKLGAPPDPGSAIALSAADRNELHSYFGMTVPITLVGNEGPVSNDFLDTTGDGVVDAADDPSLMPVTVRIQWRSRAGVITQYFSTVIGLR